MAGVAAMIVLLAGCTAQAPPDPGPGPDVEVAALTTAWGSLLADRVGPLTSRADEAELLVGEVVTALAPTGLTVTTGAVDRTSADTATTTATYDWSLPGGGTWQYTAPWAFTRTGGDSWSLDWSPAVVHPRLGARQTLAVRTTAAAPGVVVDRHDQQIVAPVRVYSVVLFPARVPDLAATAAALATALAPIDPTITPESIVAGAQAAEQEAAQPDPAAAAGTPGAGATGTTGTTGTTDPTGTTGAPGQPAEVAYTVVNLREGDYQSVQPALQGLPGLTFPVQTRDLPPTREFARALLSQVTPVAAELTKAKDGWRVVSIDTTGEELEVLGEGAATDGSRVTLGLDIGLQTAAEAVVDGIAQPALMMVMQPSTGEIMAVAQNPGTDAMGAPSFTGRFPPGSIFKIVTATAALERGLITQETPVGCPGSAIFDGREIRNNASFDLGTVTARTAFAKSCNTTFAELATQMPAEALPDMALHYGIGLDFVVPGITTLTGAVPPAESVVQRAENGFGQGQDLLTPFSALLMAATVANGTMPVPTVIRGTTTTIDRAVPAPPSAQVQRDIQDFMGAVASEDGSAKVLLPFGDVHAKTGTAEYTDETSTLQAHAWTVAYRHDLAVVAFIYGGSSSTYTNEAIARLFGSIPLD
ncbi:penicillin-binding protein [Nakamurella flavida]